MATPKKIKGRYEVRDVIGKGGMGLVYKAYDTVVQREVALKTLRDSPNKMALDLFRKECGVLASMSHPNIVEIFDIGEFTEEGSNKPYFVMPLLPGVTLDHLIRTSSQRLTVERIVEIILQTCRGLHAAHERGLVHRDLKPSNIFVMPDDAVKIIDFGVAHMADTTATMTVAGGTLPYMAPEQLEMKPASPLSDIFSLGVVFYEALTRRRPFDFPTEQETAHAILRTIPPAVSELNAGVSHTVSRVIHKSMAKQPWNRFSTAKEFADTLLKAHRNEPIEIFDNAKLEPRIQKVTKAYESGNYQFAGELLNELEAEGHVETNITLLRRQLDQAVRQKTLTNLLESARACMEEEEYLLALQKIQEIQQLDPNNSAALTLRSNIETRRSEAKIGEWTKLARQHLENNAFTHARDAIKNLLQLKPKDTSALQMLTEVDRRENEYVKARQDKQELYKAAMEAWDNGEMTSALTKFERLIDLDRRVPDTSAPEKGLSYETAYNRVRSEHDLIKNAYQEARKHLVDGNFQAALTICQQYLSKYPGHALFQALKFDVEERHRQDLSSRVAEINSRVETEPDLDRRVNILKEALDMYPGEPLFERSLRLMRDKRDLVNSIVGKARGYEERAQFNEALGQWEILQTIHKQFPGLEFEIDRVKKRRDQQSRSEAKARWVDQIDRQLEIGDYERAIDLVRNALAEFPDDPEMTSLDELARQSQARAGDAQQLFAEGQELCAQRRFDEAIELLRNAYKYDPHSHGIRTFLLEALLEQARSLMDFDWRAAEALSLQALELDPGHSLARGVRDLALDRKREDEVSQLVAEARRMQAAGNLQGALAQIEQGLATYPTEPRLTQLQATLSKSLPESAYRTESQRPPTHPPQTATVQDAAPEGWAQFEQQFREQADPSFPTVAAVGAPGSNLAPTPSMRSADMDELRVLDQQAETRVEGFDVGVERAGEIAARYPEDPEVQFLATSVKTHLATMLMQPGTSPFGAPPQPPVASPQPPVASPQPPAVGPPKTPSKPPENRERPKKSEKPPQPGKPISPMLIWGGAGGLVLLAIVAAVVLFMRPVEVRIHAVPAGALIRINGEDRGSGDVTLKLRTGTYPLEVTKEGYIPTQMDLVVKRGQVPVEVSLKPVPPPAIMQEQAQALRLSTDLSRGTVKLDDQAPVELKEGEEYTLEKLDWGHHTLEITSGGAKATISFDAIKNSAPNLTEPPKTKELKAVVVSSYGNQAKIQASNAPVKINVADTQQSGEVGPAGLDLTNLSAGAHEISLGEGKDRNTMNLNVGAGPTLQVQIYSDRNVGSLLVQTGMDDVQIEIDGKIQKKKTKGGQARFSGLLVKAHSVRVLKDGFEADAQKNVEISKGQEAKLEFRLTALPTAGILALHGAAPGTVVSVDQKQVGSVSSDGSLDVPSVTPGTHVISLSSPDGRRHKDISRPFKAGDTVTLGPPEVVLQAARGTVKIAVVPANAVITYKTSDGKSHDARNGSTLELDEGQYPFSITAPGHAEQSGTVIIASGKTVNLSTKLVAAGGSTIVQEPKADWWRATGWSREGDWYVHRGGNLVLYPTAGPGIFTFTALRQGGILSSGRIQWVAACTSPRDYILFGIDKRNIHRVEYSGGKKVKDTDNTESLKEAGAKDKLVYNVKIEVSSEAVITSVQQGGGWAVVDRAPAKTAASGKFGFFLPNNDEIYVSNFSFIPK